MMVTSLRTRVFLLVAAILALVAAFVMLVSQRTVTDTVYRAEDRATSNMLHLVALDIGVRYRQLLREKISTVRGFRGQLEAYGNTVQDTLGAFEQIANTGALSETDAQALALQWLDTLATRSGTRVLVYDERQQVLNAVNTLDHGRDLSALQDIKGRTPATDVYTDSDNALFSVYRWPNNLTGELDTHFGYFRLFSPWNWVIVVSNAADTIEEAVTHHRNEIVVATSETLRQLTLSRSGFIFLFSGDGALIVPPPAHAATLLDKTDQHSGQSLRAMLRAAANPAHDGQARFSGGDANQTWELDAQYIKALDWYVASVVPRGDLLQPAHQLLRLQGAIFLAMLGLALLLAWIYASRLIRPLDLLTQYARTLPTRDLTETQPVPPAVAALPDRHRDEVGRLATTILYMERQLVSNVQRMMAETSERERIESELSIAREIQLGLLPVPLDQQICAKVDLHATMNAAKEVGGDLYDYFMMDDGRLCFAIGDVSGKGVPAALFMAITRTLIRTAARQERTAATLMQAVNERLADHNPNMMFVTLFIGLLDLDSGELQYANAGHPLPWLLNRAGAVTTLDGRSGPACGVAEGVPYREYTTVLTPGTLLVGYTDGVTEAADMRDTLYGEERAVAVLASLPPAVSGADVAHALHEDILAFAGAAEQADDITLILICRYDTASDPL